MIVDIELIDFTSIIGCFWEMGDGKWTGAINMERTDADIKVVKRQGFILLLDLSYPQIQTLTNP